MTRRTRALREACDILPTLLPRPLASVLEGGASHGPHSTAPPGVMSPTTLVWVVAVLFFGVGDVVTTAVGIGVFGASEAAPLAAAAIDTWGLASLVVYKFLVLLAAGGVYHVAPRPARQGIPIGLALLGLLLVTWNAVILASLW